jgi:hypothetical protein
MGAHKRGHSYEHSRLHVRAEQRRCCSPVCCGHTDAFAPASAAECKGNHYWLRSMRVDPAHVLGIKPGEAVVMRNIGGRITPGLLEQLGLLGRIGEVAGAIPGGGGEFNLIVLQHTDCGITRLVDDPAMLSNTGSGTQEESGYGSPRSRCPRCCIAAVDSSIAGGVAYFRSRL